MKRSELEARGLNTFYTDAERVMLEKFQAEHPLVQQELMDHALEHPSRLLTGEQMAEALANRGLESDPSILAFCDLQEGQSYLRAERAERLLEDMAHENIHRLMPEQVNATFPEAWLEGQTELYARDLLQVEHPEPGIYEAEVAEAAAFSADLTPEQIDETYLRGGHQR
jgi:hypothetical protein